MIIVTHDYSGIEKPEMTDSFIIRGKHVIRVWDITEESIGIAFDSKYDNRHYRITLEGDSQKFLAKDLLNLILGNEEIELKGQVSIK